MEEQVLTTCGISEQMICKTGVATRENDTAERTFDQVIHESRPRH